MSETLHLKNFAVELAHRLPYNIQLLIYKYEKKNLFNLDSSETLFFNKIKETNLKNKFLFQCAFN